MAVTAGEEDPDDRLGPRRVMRPAVRRQPVRRLVGLHVAVAVQHGGGRPAGEAEAEVGEERPARDTTATCVRIRLHDNSITRYRTVTKSLWLSSALTRLSRARSIGSADAARAFGSAC